MNTNNNKPRFGFNTLGEVIPLTHCTGQLGESTHITLIAAMAEHSRGIGLSGGIPWKLPPDMKQFKRLTSGHPIIMGRNTYHSLPVDKDAMIPLLPDREHVVITNHVTAMTNLYHHPYVRFVDSLDAAMEAVKGQHAFVVGGGQIYRESLPYVNDMILTVVEHPGPTDVIFPDMSKHRHHFHTPAFSSHEHKGTRFKYYVYERK